MSDLFVRVAVCQVHCYSTSTVCYDIVLSQLLMLFEGENLVKETGTGCPFYFSTCNPESSQMADEIQHLTF